LTKIGLDHSAGPYTICIGLKNVLQINLTQVGKVESKAKYVGPQKRGSRGRDTEKQRKKRQKANKCEP